VTKVKFLATSTLVIIVFICLQRVFAQDSSEIKQIPAGLSANDVINNYLEAIGGRENLSTVKDRTTIMHAKTSGQTLSIVIEQKAPNKLKQNIRSGKMEQTILFDGKKGVMIVGDKKTELDDKKLEKLKLETAMNFLLDPEAYGVLLELAGIETIDSRLCYKILLITEEGTKWAQFYEIDSGLKIKEIKEMETTLGSFQQETFYSDYKEVDSLKFPFNIKQSFGTQTVEMNVSSIKLNDGLDDSIFEIPE
jgi:zinc protease